jgi:tetratricopeptide (TPR) repeat protein
MADLITAPDAELRDLHKSQQPAKLPWSEVKSCLERLVHDGPAQLSEGLFSYESLLREPNNRNESDESCLSYTLKAWSSITDRLLSENPFRFHVHLAILVAFLRYTGRRNIQPLPGEYDSLWDLLYGILTQSTLALKAISSSQGFLAVPIWSIVKDGKIEEHIRFHVWFPHGERGNKSIHSHQSFAQSWVLFGEGRDHTYQIEPAEATNATHAEYEVSWTDRAGKDSGTTYHVDQKLATIVNTNRLVRATETSSDVHTRNMTYTVGDGVYHRSEVAADSIHATIFFFDSTRGCINGPSVLGPPFGGPKNQERDPGTYTPADMAKAVNSMRAWERSYLRGLARIHASELEEAKLTLNSARAIYLSNQALLKAPKYLWAVDRELGYVARMLGRYSEACNIMENVLREMPRGEAFIAISGELAVSYRHLNRLQNAKEVLEDQYESAKQLNDQTLSEKEMCRAIGNLGMIYYQLFLQTNLRSDLTTAIAQFTQRVEMARNLRLHTALSVRNSEEQNNLRIGLSRLSLCHSALNETADAVCMAKSCQDLTFEWGRTGDKAFSRFWYGRALLLDGQHQAALEQFNPSDGFTPLSAFCKEPSDEHRGYIKEMIAAGADLQLRDANGYSALDFAVYSGETETQDLILKSLQDQLGMEAAGHHLFESMLRKGYREIFQDKLRSILLSLGEDDELWWTLRTVYNEALAQDKEKSNKFDRLKYIRYTDFVQHGKLPQAADGITRYFDKEEAKDSFIVFVSYRWAVQVVGEPLCPDDRDNTRYIKMVNALNDLRRAHPELAPERLYIWLVSAPSSPRERS